MCTTKPNKEQGTWTRKKGRTEPLWNVVLHNEWDHLLQRVILVLKRVIPGMTLRSATKISWEAHRKGRAIVKCCHKELAELYKELLQKEGLTVSLEPAR
jgi:ATP-dependent Clp protease adaptor protein ClpS